MQHLKLAVAQFAVTLLCLGAVAQFAVALLCLGVKCEQYDLLGYYSGSRKRRRDQGNLEGSSRFCYYAHAQLPAV